MTVTSKVNIILGIIAIGLLVTFFSIMLKAPTFMLPSVYLALMLTFALLTGSLIVSGMIKLIFQKTSFLLILMSVISISSIAGIYKLYSPQLTIIVPKGYVGQVSLVLSNVSENILTVDRNGIGYITKKTYNNTYTAPVVLEEDGTNITSRCVGFNPTSFWARESSSEISISSSGENKSDQKILALTFEVVPKGKEGQKQYYNIDIFKFVDKSKLYDEKSNR